MGRLSGVTVSRGEGGSRAVGYNVTTRPEQETGTDETFLSVYRRDEAGLDCLKADTHLEGAFKPAGCALEQVKVVQA